MTYLQPLLLGLMIITAFGLFRLRKCRGVLVPAVGLLGLFLLSWPPADWLLSRHLEARYTVKPFSGGTAQAIVVLSSAVDPPRYETPYALPDTDSYQRCQLAAWLHTHWLPLPILASGGPEPIYTDTMRGLLRQAGVPEAMIWTEAHSHSTHENAVFSAKILREKRIGQIVLVVDAKDMLRAQLCFRKEGLMVLPAPSAIRQFGSWDEEIMPSWKAIYRNERTLHETAGLVWYRLRGWI